MSSRWFLAPLLILSLSNSTFSQKLINNFFRERTIQGLPAGFALKSFDVTGDNVSEIFVLTGSQLLLFDGKTYSMIFRDSAAPGTNNLNQADVNQDGFADLVANSSDTAVVVWYGPDFSNRSLFAAPQRGFRAFAVRNREDGQVEFSFGFRHEFTLACPPSIYGSSTYTVLDGYLRRFIDTSFIADDSISLRGAPVQVDPVRISNSTDLVLVEDYYSNQRNCDPSLYYKNLWFQRLHLDALTGSTYYNYWCFHCGPGCFLVFSGRPVIGNIDLDEGPEFIVKWEEWNSLSCLPPVPTPRYLVVYDLVTNTGQFSHPDSFPYLSPLFVLDINQDGVGELLSYQVISGKPSLLEYNTSNGSTLGLTELPLPSSKLLLDVFGQPPAPKVLLGYGDSVVVYRINCAANRGDINADGNVTIADIVLELDCVFLGTGNCELCLADVNCDGRLSAADVIWGLIAVFQQRPFPCS